MRTRQLLLWLFLALLILAAMVEAKKKGKIKMKKVKVKKAKPIKINKKVKRFFAVKHHHKKKHKTTASTTILPTSTLYLSPTLTTFTSFAMTPTPVLLTITDRSLNYFFGYAATVNGAQYYNNANYMVAGPRRCGCGDSHPIFVTVIPDDIGI